MRNYGWIEFYRCANETIGHKTTWNVLEIFPYRFDVQGVNNSRQTECVDDEK